MDKADLFRPRLPEEDVEIPGGTVRVRGLSRLEAMDVQQAGGPQVIERRMLALAMVDPKLTEDEVRQWQNASPASEIEPVTDAIARLSGLAPGADKETYKSFRGEPGAGVRALPSAEAGDDGGPAPVGHEQ